ncbi:antitermination protein NusB [Kosmotoga arenicorallina S304]|uniref:Transcription antitermination protein NusB n=1 Tax=Kosmotoga arenicorallina S304 TaxID=1453497 RepID=A0A182C8B2_9BACT|nr:transcription antitermination factor NusB [Kosmotoga arenicorallina]OAA31723.1 antitermination protein NusB [Kosmotoga arenicorallina S304]
MAEKRGNRRRMRDIVFKSVFQYDFHKDADAAAGFLRKESGFHSFDEVTWQRANKYLSGILEHLEELDRVISSHLINWTFDRLTAVDKNVLRLGTYELLYELDIPIEVTLNEAIELAKKYGSVEDGKFVNGVLDRIAKQHTPPSKRGL